MKKLEVTLEVFETKELCTINLVVTFCSMSDAFREAYGSCSSCCSSC